jgi:UDP-2,3-diacylglucosamine pyrophosphatase LpxH
VKDHYKTIWISDVHLGTRGCQAKYLLDFLDKHKCDKLYLVGDIIDGWVMSRTNVYWPQEHTNVIRKVLTMSKKGTEIVYISGNHDEFLRNYEDLAFGNITVVNEDVHETVDGKQMLVLHGDQFDAVTRYHKWVAILGDYGYRFLIWANGYLNRIRARMGKPYWSLSAFIKHKVKTAVSFMSEYNNAVAFAAKQRNVNHVVCGHIHHAEITQIDDVMYYNCGDWVESCTALVEDENGDISIIQWAKVGHEEKDSDSN